MSYNCGCELPDDDIGKGYAVIDSKGTSITNKTFQAADNGEAMSEEDAKRNTLDLLRKILGV